MDSYFKELLGSPADSKPAVSANPPPAPHESWCYRTLGKVDCYDRPLPGEASRLVSVDPPSRMPLNREAYANDTLDAARK